MRIELKWGPAHRIAMEDHYSLSMILDLHEALDYDAEVQKYLSEQSMKK